MNRTGWTVLAVAGVIVLVVVAFEVLTRDAGEPSGEQPDGLSSPSLQPDLPAPGTKADIPGRGDAGAEGAEQMDAIRRATATARRLEKMIEEIDGLRRPTVRATLDSLEMLREDLTELLERTKAQYAKSA